MKYRNNLNWLIPFTGIWFALLPLTSPAQSSVNFEKASFISKNGTEVPYRILLPENYNPRKKYPLVLFLHGAGERGDDNESQLVHGSKLFLENRSAHPSIVIFPQCPKDRFWSSVKINRDNPENRFNFDYVSSQVTPELSAVMELLQDLGNKHKVDRKRRYVMGLSMGGMGTFEAITRYPGFFAAAIPICGGGDPSLADRFSKKLPLWVFHGSDDKVVPPDCSTTMVKAIQAAGGQVKYTEYPGVGHNSWDPAFAEPDLLSWLFSQKK